MVPGSSGQSRGAVLGRGRTTREQGRAAEADGEREDDAAPAWQEAPRLDGGE